ncbi:hypothetical protein FB45DRAFT_1021081 [Roridomyces roridus]|uniref:U6 snRNA phosphodiesterase 1 n=1 Tax=Roridomyces roridus TaxID=1738132 RepID=A0AAD7CBM0_9AGAR|nr:hypothetical protein FB45DRAFT_1021081 [Roridomyces roridus]
MYIPGNSQPSRLLWGAFAASLTPTGNTPFTSTHPCLLIAGSALFKLVSRIVGSAKSAVPALHDFSSDLEPELHISLSRPIYLRAHQREDLKRAVKQIAEKTLPFVASFAQLTQLANDEGTRTFLALEIGAGYHEFKCLADMLTPTLHAIRQQEFYSTPRFHASIAWALLDWRPF